MIVVQFNYPKCTKVCIAIFKLMQFTSSRFSQFDIDGDGAITSDELRHAMVKLLGEHTSKHEIEAVVREADNNGDGTVDFEGEYTNTH